MYLSNHAGTLLAKKLAGTFSNLRRPAREYSCSMLREQGTAMRETGSVAPRVAETDAVRGVAVFLVPLVHVTHGGLTQLSELGLKPYLTNAFYNVVAHHGVTLFVIVSGYFLLVSARDEPPAAFLRKRLTKIVVPICSGRASTFYGEPMSGTIQFLPRQLPRTRLGPYAPWSL